MSNEELIGLLRTEIEQVKRDNKPMEGQDEEKYNISKGVALACEYFLAFIDRIRP